jgi:hypothetical protein
MSRFDAYNGMTMSDIAAVNDEASDEREDYEIAADDLG